MRQAEALGDVLATAVAADLEDPSKHPGAGLAQPRQLVRAQEIAHHHEAITVEYLRRTPGLPGIADRETPEAVVRSQVIAERPDPRVVR